MEDHVVMMMRYAELVEEADGGTAGEKGQRAVVV